MSDSLEAFWARAAWDPVIKARLSCLDASSTEAAITSLVAVANEFGFSFTADDYRATLPDDAAASGPTQRPTIALQAEALAEAYSAEPRRARRSKSRRVSAEPTTPKPEAAPRSTLREEELDAPATSRVERVVQEDNSCSSTCTDF